MITLILFGLFLVEGQSMEPEYKHDTHIQTIHGPCALNDAIVFTHENETYIKYLTDRKSNGAIFVQGRSGTWLDHKTKERKRSIDSNEWGWLMPHQYEIKGCVKPGLTSRNKRV